MSFTHRRRDRLRLVLTSAFVGLTATVALPALAAAQRGGAAGGGGGGGGGGRMMTALFDGITLTDAERKTVDSIRSSYQPQMEQLRSQGQGSRPQMRDLMQKEMADFRGALTPDQQSAFDKNREAMQARMQQGGGAGGGGGGTNPQ
jgi:Spy/CpxP family protein refolding chaperone